MRERARARKRERERERETLRENFNISNEEKVDREKDEDAAVQRVHEGSSSPACGTVVEDDVETGHAAAHLNRRRPGTPPTVKQSTPHSTNQACHAAAASCEL